MAEGASAAALARGATVSRTVWRAGDRRRRESAGCCVGRVTIPAAVATLNRLRIGPFSATLSGEELRRAGLLAMGRVAETLAPDAEHVLFGHTHRAGPLPGDDWAEWSTLSGERLWNSGNWYLESTFVQGHRPSAAPTGPGRSCGWSRAGRRGSRTRCAATRRRAPARSRAAQRVGGLVEFARAPAKGQVKVGQIVELRPLRSM